MVLEMARLATDDQEALEDPVAPQDASVIGAKKGSGRWAQTRPPWIQPDQYRCGLVHRS